VLSHADFCALVRQIPQKISVDGSRKALLALAQTLLARLYAPGMSDRCGARKIKGHLPFPRLVRRTSFWACSTILATHLPANAGGVAVMPIRITSSVKPGELFATFHFAEIFLNRVTSPHRDRHVRTPEYKVTGSAN
jgi:hypothetical protein